MAAELVVVVVEVGHRWWLLVMVAGVDGGGHPTGMIAGSFIGVDGCRRWLSVVATGDHCQSWSWRWLSWWWWSSAVDVVGDATKSFLRVGGRWCLLEPEGSRQ